MLTILRNNYANGSARERLPYAFSGDQDRGIVFVEFPLGVDPLLQRHAAVDRAAVEAQIR